MDEPVRQAVLALGPAATARSSVAPTRDPWQVLVSEVMLQQTQVDRVVPKWTGFHWTVPIRPRRVRRRRLGDVLRMWQGLGYPRRAQNLHRSAQASLRTRRVSATPWRAARTSGRWCTTPPRAVLAFAFEARRCGGRHQHRHESLPACGVNRCAPRTCSAMLTWPSPWRSPGRGIRALMDLGAVLCRARNAALRANVHIAGWCVVGAGRGDDPAVGFCWRQRRAEPV